MCTAFEPLSAVSSSKKYSVMAPQKIVYAEAIMSDT